MNLARIMIPKVSTACIQETDTVRQGLERFEAHGYSAIPVLNEDGQYIGSVTEGDFLRHILRVGSTDKKAHEKYRIRQIVRPDFCRAVAIDADYDIVLEAILNQNYVPVVDGRGVFCGIVTRKKFIEYLDGLAISPVLR